MGKFFQAFIMLIFLIGSANLSAQTLEGIAVDWRDNFSEWTIFYNETEEGELQTRWQIGEDWTEWTYRLEDYYGQIKVKWDGRLNEWEVRGNGKIVTARTIWKDDFSEWRITDNNKTLNWKSQYRNILETWKVTSQDYGYFELYTNWEGDPREWVIIDELDEAISLEMKMAMIFTTLFSRLENR